MKDPSFQCDLVSWHCHNKLPQAGRLETIGIYSLALFWGLKSEMEVLARPCARGNPPLPLPAARVRGIPWLMTAKSNLYLCLYLASLSSLLSLKSPSDFLLPRTLSLDSGPTLNPGWSHFLIYNWIIYEKSPFFLWGACGNAVFHSAALGWGPKFCIFSRGPGEVDTATWRSCKGRGNTLKFSHWKTLVLGVLIVAQWKQIWLVSMRMQIWSLVSFGGLRIWHCHEW